RRKPRASFPWIVYSPAVGRLMWLARRSTIGPLTQTFTPPTAFDIFTTPPKVIIAAYGTSNPVSASTVFTVQASPPYDRVTFMGCADIEAWFPLPSARGQDGIGTTMSLGKLTAVTCDWSWATCTRIVTSLSAEYPARTSLPTIRRLK